MLRADETAPLQPAVSSEVDDVDRLHAHAATPGLRVVYPVTDEPWGVRRFWVEDPNGVVINILGHQPSSDDE
ncbi:VOC family protein [Singulisphaera rosea]